MNRKIGWMVVIFLVIGGVVWLSRAPAKPGALDSFAQCLVESGAKYYGAFWCPNCKNQEAMFGRSKRLLPRIECSTPDGRGQLPICREVGIEGYPTWDFSDGTRLTGTLSLQKLGELSGCPLPEND